MQILSHRQRCINTIRYVVSSLANQFRNRIGSTDRLGGEPESHPVTFEEIHAALYHNLASSPRLFDSRDRPQSLVDPSIKPIKELV